MSHSNNAPSVRRATGRARVVIVIIPVGVALMTLNWFGIAPTFGQLSATFGVSIPRLALLVAAFVAGFGACHIPAGFLATRIGLRATLVAGLALEGVTAALSGVVDGYWPLLSLRVLAGCGAAIFTGAAIPAISVWFAGRAHALALGVISAAFSLGAGLGLFVWGDVAQELGWRAALVIGGVAAVLCAVVTAVAYRVPPGSSRLSGTRVTRDAVRQTLGNIRLWRYGLAFFGGYGAYFGAAQLVQTYARDGRGFTVGQAGMAALLIGLAGIPGSIIAGWLSDRLRRRRAVMLAMIALEAAGLLLIPLAAGDWIWLPAFLVGFAFNGCFAVWQTVPGEDTAVHPEHIGIAIGLMLTIGAVGGFALPWSFGALVPASGYGAAWTMLGVVTLAAGLMMLLGRQPRPQAATESRTLPATEVGADG